MPNKVTYNTGAGAGQDENLGIFSSFSDLYAYLTKNPAIKKIEFFDFGGADQIITGHAFNLDGFDLVNLTTGKSVIFTTNAKVTPFFLKAPASLGGTGFFKTDNNTTAGPIYVHGSATPFQLTVYGKSKLDISAGTVGAHFDLSVASTVLIILKDAAILGTTTGKLISIGAAASTINVAVENGATIGGNACFVGTSVSAVLNFNLSGYSVANAPTITEAGFAGTININPNVNITS